MSELKVDKITPRLGTTLTLGDAGDTINFGSGVLPNFENLTVTGDLTVDTNSLKVDSTNNFVGIGTASPSVALDVVGAITATGNITGTLATASQPNITSVGTLTSATISGDLTVDTNTLYVDSTNNRVGIGTTSPQSGLDLTSSIKGSWTSGNVYSYPTGNAYIKVQGTSNEHNWIGISGVYDDNSSSANLLLQANLRNTNEQAGNYIGSEAQTSTSAHLTFGKLIGGSAVGVNATKTEAMRIDNSGNVGIGTTSLGTYKLSVDSGTAGNTNAEAGLYLSGTRAGVVYNIVSNTANTTTDKGSGIKFQNGGFDTGAIIIRNDGASVSGDSAGYMTFHTSDDGTENLSERMRIDSSGNWMVGKTSVDLGVTGVEFRAGSYNAMTNDGGVPLYLNRLTSDGGILEFRKDDATVGSINASGSRLGIGSGSVGLWFDNTSYGAVRPFNVSTNSDNDNVVDLGSSGSRFKNAYLSGNVYLGGTGSANALDDYEEGTFTPLVEGTTTSGSATYTTRVAKYTKVGNIVHFNIFIRWQSGTGSGPFIITGLPFTSVGSSYHSAVTIGWMNDYDYTNGKIPRAYVPSSISRINFEESTDNGGSTNLNYDSQAGLILSGSYETS